VSRREFLTFCSSVALVLGVKPSRVIAALAAGPRPCVLWLNFSGCTGCTESALRMVSPFFDDLVRSSVSLDYHEVLMAPAGQSAESILTAAATANTGNFLCVVEGSIPTGASAGWGMIGGRTMLSIAEEICPQARAVICLGSCSSYGGLAAAAPNPSLARSVTDALPGLTVPVVRLPGCPPNPVNLAALLMNYLLVGSTPALDSALRPTFAYGRFIHMVCPYYNTQRCQETRGCKGPVTHNNCSQAQFNEGTSFPMKVGHPCIGCSEPGFWDTMSPFYTQYHVGVVPHQATAVRARSTAPVKEFDLQGRLTAQTRAKTGYGRAAGVRVRKQARTRVRVLDL